MTDIDPRLRTELGQRAGQIDVTGDFATRAIEIEERAHRRRVATAALGSALALAVAAPVVYSAMTPEQQRPVPASSSTAPTPTATTTEPAPTASPTASATPTAIPTFDTGAKPLATALPKLGPATDKPDVPYAVDGVLHDGDREVPLPLKTNIWNLALVDQGAVLVQGGTETGSPWSLLDSSGKELADLTSYQSFVVGEDGSRLLVSGADGYVRVLDAKGGVVWELPSDTSPVALMGDLAFIQGGGLGQESVVWNIATGEPRLIKGTVRDVNAARGIVLVLDPQTIPNPDEVCYSILDVDTLTTQSRGCGPVAPMRLSPQGTYVIGTGSFDGGGPITLSVVRVDDGRVVLKVDDSIGAWTYRMNEDETHLTLSASEAGPTPTTNNALVRCDLSGGCVVVGDSRKMGMVGGLPASVWAVAQD